MKKKKPKIVYLEDDGRTLYSMSGLEPFSQTKKENTEVPKIELTKKEKKVIELANKNITIRQYIFPFFHNLGYFLR